MLDMSILEQKASVASGRVTLNSLQNMHVPMLDLLVREAIQNSSDASLQVQDTECFKVNFRFGKFLSKKFSSLLTDITGTLNKNHPEDEASYLEIRDTNTTGLTGPVRIQSGSDHGNFVKLIFDYGVKQSQANAGGNWGFGKSVYYRLGIGLVVFYSQIKSGDQYESRMIICLVEDETKRNEKGEDVTILGPLNNKSAGKAWWGKKSGEDILPLTDLKEIQSVLDLFGIKPFKFGETGTAVIIPYINEAELLDDIIPQEASVPEGQSQSFALTWQKTIERYLELSIQRWYAPKIQNKALPGLNGGKWLYVKVGSKGIRKDEMLPFFKLIQELYNCALAQTVDKQYDSEIFPQIKTFDINVKNHFEHGTRCGIVSYLDVSDENLKKIGEAALSPYFCAGKYDVDPENKDSIVTFTRDPGMIIDYSLTGPWNKSLKSSRQENSCLVAFFVPNTKKTIRSNFAVKKYAGMQFGEYLRQCEASDHMEWNDPAKMQIVKRIQVTTVSHLNGRLNLTSEEEAKATASKLAGHLGKCLLPMVGYKKMGRKGTGGEGHGGGGKLDLIKPSFTIKNISDNLLEVDFSIKLLQAKRDFSLDLNLLTVSYAWIKPEKWQEDVGIEFPAFIESFQVNSMSYGAEKQKLLNIVCDETNSQYQDENLEIVISKTATNSRCTNVKVKTDKPNLLLVGKIYIRAIDKKYKFSLSLE